MQNQHSFVFLALSLSIFLALMPFSGNYSGVDKNIKYAEGLIGCVMWRGTAGVIYLGRFLSRNYSRGCGTGAVRMLVEVNAFLI